MTSAVALAVPAAFLASQTYRPPSLWSMAANRKRPPAASTLTGSLASLSFDLNKNYSVAIPVGKNLLLTFRQL